MDLRTELSVRYYNWALVDAARELESDFNLLKRIKGKGAIRGLRFLQSLPHETQHPAMEALVRRFHRPALTALGEGLEPWEDALVERYLTEIDRPDSLESRLELSPMRPDEFNRELEAAIRYQVRSLGAGSFHQGEDARWRFSFVVRDWTVNTHVHAAHPLFYFHHVKWRDLLALEQVSLLSWMGLTSQTRWDLVAQQDIPVAAETLATCCRRFLEAVPELLAI